MNIKKQLVNDKPIRYLDKDSEFWVVVCDLAVAPDFIDALAKTAGAFE